MPIQRVDGVLAHMWDQVAAWEAQGDHRAVFLTVYATMTGWVRRHLAEDAFVDPAWVAGLTVDFAGIYVDWVVAYDAGRPVPRAWQMAFDLAARREAFVLQDALFGVNAHINYDLALVESDRLRQAGDRDTTAIARRQFDHEQINRALIDAVPDVQRELRRRYARWCGALDRAGSHVDERLMMLGLHYYRGRVWQNATWLALARDEAERARVLRRLDLESVEVAQQIYQAGRLGWPGARALARWCRRRRLL